MIGRTQAPRNHSRHVRGSGGLAHGRTATVRAEGTVLGNSCVFQTEMSAEAVGVVSTESGDAVQKGEGRATYVGWTGGQGRWGLDQRLLPGGRLTSRGSGREMGLVGSPSCLELL